MLALVYNHFHSGQHYHYVLLFVALTCSSVPLSSPVLAYIAGNLMAKTNASVNFTLVYVLIKPHSFVEKDLIYVKIDLFGRICTRYK